MEVVVYRANWSPEHKALSTYMLVGRADSIEALPRWIQERYAVLRLLNEHEESPLGMWRQTTTYSLDAILGGQRAQRRPCLLLYVVWLPDDPETKLGWPSKGAIPLLQEGTRQ